MWAKINNGTVEKYPYSIGDLRADNPNTSFPGDPEQEILQQYGVVNVDPVDRPTVDTNTQYVIEGAPEQNGGVWQQTWVIVPYSQEQIDAVRSQAEVRVRSQRDSLLRECDWTQCSDVVLQNKDAWITYRQALRDVPEQQGFPWSINWPDRP